MEEARFGIRMPCDDDDFILLRCPHCGELFKLTAEDIESDETLDIYCPSCGLCANNFLTQNVIDLALAKTSNYAMYAIAQQLQAFAKKKQQRSRSIRGQSQSRKGAGATNQGGD